jgi:hypothetical protein
MTNMAASAWMVGGSVLTCLAAAAIGGQAVMPETVFGMAAPLVSAVASWRVIARTHAAAPERLTTVLVTAFALKAVLFGAYVVVVLGALALRPVPFIAAFTSYYVALHFGEALLLKRLLAARG